MTAPLDDALPIVYDYTLHGLRLRVKAGNAVLGDDLDFLFHYLRAERVDTDATVPDLTMTFRTSEASQTVPEGVDFLGEHDRGIKVFGGGGILYVHYGASRVDVDPASGSCAALLGPNLPADKTQRQGLLFDLATLSLLILLRPHEQYLLHAACVVHDGTGVLISASSGSGKSSLALSLVRAGWPYLSDDILLLHRADNGIAARGMGRHFRITPEGIHRFPELAAIQSPGEVLDKVHLDVDALYPGQFVVSTRPRFLIFPEIVDAPQSSLHPMSRTEALLRLLAQTTLISPDRNLADLHVGVLKDLVKQVKAFRLAGGVDLYRDASLAARLLAPLF